MSAASRRARARAMGTALLLLAAGAVLGIGVDRLWLSPTLAEGMSLTPGAMSERLGLTAEEEARLSILLDSLHDVMTAAAAEGPDALRAATASAHRRIEDSLRPESRPAFHGWMQEHREHMMRRMHPGPMPRGMMHRAPPAGPDADDPEDPPSGSR